MKIHIIQHESFEAPGAFLEWIHLRKHEVNITHVYRYEPLPASTEAFDFLIVLGGPQSPKTTKMDCPYFDAAREIALIQDGIKRHKLILGVCLGAQLVGEAYGAPFDHSPEREIGIFDIELTDAAGGDPIFATFPKKFPVAHWHGDMPGLPPRAEILAMSYGCPKQIVYFNDNVYGFQCHFEFTPQMMELMIKYCKEELQQFKDHPFVESPAKLRSHNFLQMNQLLFSFLDRFTEPRH